MLDAIDVALITLLKGKAQQGGSGGGGTIIINYPDRKIHGNAILQPEMSDTINIVSTTPVDSGYRLYSFFVYWHTQEENKLFMVGRKGGQMHLFAYNIDTNIWEDVINFQYGAHDYESGTVLDTTQNKIFISMTDGDYLQKVYEVDPVTYSWSLRDDILTAIKNVYQYKSKFLFFYNNAIYYYDREVYIRYIVLSDNTVNTLLRVSGYTPYLPNTTMIDICSQTFAMPTTESYGKWLFYYLNTNTHEYYSKEPGAASNGAFVFNNNWYYKTSYFALYQVDTLTRSFRKIRGDDSRYWYGNMGLTNGNTIWSTSDNRKLGYLVMGTNETEIDNWNDGTYKIVVSQWDGMTDNVAIVIRSDGEEYVFENIQAAAELGTFANPQILFRGEGDVYYTILGIKQ